MSKPVRILHVLGKLNRGGAETMIMNLYRNIDRNIIQFDFIVHTENKCDYEEEINQLGGRIYRIPRYTGKNHFSYIKSWKDFFKNHPEYKIIHGHVRSTAALYLKIAKRNGLTTIAHSHSTSSGSGIASLVKNLLQLPIRRISDYFLACSENAGKWLFGNKILKGKNFFILKNSIDIEKFILNSEIRDKIKREFNIKNKFVVGHVGNFIPVKNHAFIIDVFKSLKAKKENLVLLLVGDGGLKESIKLKVRQDNLENIVIFAGLRSDVNEILQGMDMLLMPSLYEGLPVTLIEAQASGLKCFVSDKITQDVKITDLVEFIPLEKDKEYWAEFILKYIEKTKKRINTTMQIKAAGYDVQQNAKWLTDFYSVIIKNKK